MEIAINIMGMDVCPDTDYQTKADLWAFAGHPYEADILHALGFVYQGECFDTGRQQLGASFHKKINQSTTASSVEQLRHQG